MWGGEKKGGGGYYQHCQKWSNTIIVFQRAKLGWCTLWTFWVLMIKESKLSFRTLAFSPVGLHLETFEQVSPDPVFIPFLPFTFLVFVVHAFCVNQHMFSDWCGTDWADTWISSLPRQSCCHSFDFSCNCSVTGEFTAFISQVLLAVALPHGTPEVRIWLPACMAGSLHMHVWMGPFTLWSGTPGLTWAGHVVLHENLQSKATLGMVPDLNWLR